MKNNSIRHWMVLIGACLLMLSASAMSCLSFFIEPVTSELGYTRSTFTLYMSLITFANIFTMPLLGNLFSKIGARKLIAISGVVCSTGLVALSFSTSLLSFYISGLLFGLLLPSITMLGPVVLVNSWFEKKKGLLMGIVMSLSGLGGAIGGFLMPMFISNFGWRSGYLLLSVIFFLLTVPSAIFLIRNTPESVGLLPYGAVEDNTKLKINESVQPAEKKEIQGMPFSKAIKSNQFYLLYIGIALLAITISFFQHIPAYFIDRGLTPVLTGRLMSISMLALIFTKIIIGTLKDKFGTIITMILCYGLLLAFFIILPIASNYNLFILCMIFISFGSGTLTVLSPLITSDIFGQKEYTRIYGVIGTAAAVGMTIGTPFWGYIYDKTSSYNLGFYSSYLLIPVVVILLVFVLKFKIPYHELNKGD